MREVSPEIVEYMAKYHCTPDDLTDEEIAEVIEEYNLVQKGHLFLDGVLEFRFSPYRDFELSNANDR